MSWLVLVYAFTLRPLGVKIKRLEAIAVRGTLAWWILERTLYRDNLRWRRERERARALDRG